MGFAIATNAIANDEVLIEEVVESWMRTFSSHLEEIFIGLDDEEPEGRIAELQGTAGSLSRLKSKLDRMARSHDLVRWDTVPATEELADISEKWFGERVPKRGQAGTPILPFVWAIEKVTGDIILKCDSDMIFRDSGWVEWALNKLNYNEIDIVSPPRMGENSREECDISTRALMMSKNNFTDINLPITPGKLGVLRSVDRWFRGRNAYLSLEESLQIECLRGKVSHAFAGKMSGSSIHIAERKKINKKDI